MKTIIISSSLSPKSRSFLLCQAVSQDLSKKSIDVDLVDLREYELNPFHRPRTPDMDKLTQKVKNADNIIIGLGIHNYSISDSLKLVLDNCFTEATGKFFGIITAAGGQRSYLATMHLTQTCMNQWRMIQLPRVIYATGGDFVGNDISNEDLIDRLGQFCDEFSTIGHKLMD